jgi:hypothetical protein
MSAEVIATRIKWGVLILPVAGLIGILGVALLLDVAANVCLRLSAHASNSSFVSKASRAASTSDASTRRET